MFADYHTHTSFSEDSEYLMEDCLNHALELGIEEICFTEHTDYGVKDTGSKSHVCPVEDYYAEYLRCKKIFDGKIKIKFGMECGVQVGTVPDYEKLFKAYPFDFIILSCHQVDNLEFWNQDYQKGRTQEEYNKKYYEEIFKVMKIYDNWSVIGHLDSINRYDLQGEYPFEKVRDIVTEILKLAIEKGKGIEINTSCYRYNLPDLTPSHEILKIYKDLGGEILTFGSDSHQENHLGFKIEETKKELADMGFKYFFTFDKMQPVANKI